MLNPKVVEIYGVESQEILNSILSDLGDELAQVCYVSTKGYVITSGVKIPCNLITASGRVDEVRKSTREFRRTCQDLYIHEVGRIPDGYIALYAHSVRKDRDYILNPKLVELYGEGSREPLDMLIDILGDQVAPTVYVAGNAGCRYVNGVKMPNGVTTESAQVNYVENCVNRFYDEWGGGVMGETIEVWTEMLEKGDIPLCVSNKKVAASSVPSNAKYKVNPELVAMYGEESRDMLTRLVDAVGDRATMCNVITEYGIQYVNSVKMPSAMSVGYEHVSCVEERVVNFLEEWGGKKGGVSMDVFEERFKKGDVPLAVPEIGKVVFNAAALMGGD